MYYIDSNTVLHDKSTTTFNDTYVYSAYYKQQRVKYTCAFKYINTNAYPVTDQNY